MYIGDHLILVVINNIGPHHSSFSSIFLIKLHLYFHDIINFIFPLITLSKFGRYNQICCSIFSRKTEKKKYNNITKNEKTPSIKVLWHLSKKKKRNSINKKKKKKKNPNTNKGLHSYISLSFFSLYFLFFGGFTQI